MKWTARLTAQILAGAGVLATVGLATPTLAEECISQSSCSVRTTKESASAEFLNQYEGLYENTKVLDNIFTVRSKRSVDEFGQKVLSVPHDRLSVVSVSSEEKLQALFNSNEVEYIAPVFEKDGIRMIMTDSAMVMFDGYLSEAQAAEKLLPYGLVPERDMLSGIWEVKSNGKTAIELINAIDQLRDDSSVLFAEVDTIQKTGRMNYTGEYGQKDFGGTSGAVALVAGTVGLMRDANNDLDAYQIMDILRQTANPGFGGTVEDSPDSFISADNNGEWADIETTVAVSLGNGMIDFVPRVIQYSPTYGDGIIDPFTAVSTARNMPGGISPAEVFSRPVPNLTDDPLTNLQWYSFQSIYGQLVSSFSYLNIDGIYNSVFRPDANNTNVRLVVMDDGIATDHPEINLAQQFDTVTGLSFSTSAQPRSGTGHGTAVAGILAARDNQSGIVGMLPGYPIIGVRVEAVEGDRANEHFFTRISDVVFGLSFVNTQAISNPSLRYVVAVTTAGIPSYNALGEDDDTSFVTGIVRQLAANNVNVILPIGNGNENLDDEDITYFEIGPQELIELDEGENPNLQSALIVSAVHSRASIVNQGPSGAKASYSNTGNQVSISAPSGDDQFNTFQTREDNIVLPRKLSMVAPDVNFLSLGGNDIREYDVTANYTATEITIEIPPAGVVGISNWPTMCQNLYTSNQSATENEFLNRGIFFPINAGTIEILPLVTQDENGIISGTSLVKIRDSNDVVTSERVVPTTGRFIVQRSGTRRDNESFSSAFILNGSDSLGNAFFISGRESFRIQNGQIFDGSDTVAAKSIPLTPAYEKIGPPVPDPPKINPPDESGYRVTAAIKIQGGGVARTSGHIRRSRLSGSEVNGFPDGGDDNVIDYSLASFYSPNIAPTQTTPSRNGGVTQIIGGSASLDSDFDFLTSFGNTGVRARIIYSPPGQRGEYIAIGRNGNYSGRTSGFHTAANDQVIIDLADATSFASSVVFRTPGASNNVSENDLPEFMFVD